MTELKGKKVLVVGLGRSGEASALFLRKKGALVRLTEAADGPELKEKKSLFQEWNQLKNYRSYRRCLPYMDNWLPPALLY